MPTCVAYNCTSRVATVTQSRKTRNPAEHDHKTEDQRSLNFFSFPSDPVLRNKWVHNCRRKDWKPSKWSRLCSKHFKKDLISRRPFKCVLANGAIPTIFDFSDNSRAIKSTHKGWKRSHPKKETKIIKEEEEEEGKPNEMYNYYSYAIDDHSYSLPNSMDLLGRANKKAKLHLNSLLEENEHLNDIIKTLKKNERRSKQKTLRLQKQINKMEDRFTSLPSGILKILLERSMVSKKETLSRNKYPEELKKFALTLRFYSPKCYKYVRNAFNMALPHPSVVRSWYGPIDG
eukprot:TRINITY_DN5861_c0_g1_i1.p1 TRINITY_DN5861_c0_g1~~TRINITY_DN5861_c0_g1_i1.p1  ORF type:complete len:288 (+),score=-4.88 TRINITY_DN5861_c0_g1_i1:361-1224(+)